MRADKANEEQVSTVTVVTAKGLVGFDGFVLSCDILQGTPINITKSRWEIIIYCIPTPKNRDRGANGDICNIMAEGFRFIYLAFRLVHGLVGCNINTGVYACAERGCVIQRCKNKYPRQKLGPGDVSDVTHRKRGLRICGLEKKQ